MKFKWKALIAAVALAIPALAWAATSLQAEPACPVPCDDCPFNKR